jgi:hypothetical protein
MLWFLKEKVGNRSSFERRIPLSRERQAIQRLLVDGDGELFAAARRRRTQSVARSYPPTENIVVQARWIAKACKWRT